MKEIICDTNIWYGLGNGSINKPKNVKLIATWNNIIEIGFSHQKIKKLINVDEVKKAAKAILEHSDEIIENDPFTYSANKLAPELKIQTKSLKFILNEISENGPPDDISYYENIETYNNFMQMKEMFAKELNERKPEIRKRIYSSKIFKKSFKDGDNTQLNEQAYSVLLDVDSYLGKDHNKRILIDDENDLKETLNNIKLNFELYVYTKQEFLKKWILTKEMKIEDNDFYDLLNLLYVEKGQYYWTKENRWISALNEANMEKYLWK